MGIRSFDHDYVEEIVNRAGRLKPDAKPMWGTMSPPQMIGHLIEGVGYSMGRGPNYPPKWNVLTRRVLAPLVLRGFLKIPKNVKVPRPPGANPNPIGDVEDLHAILDEYLGMVQADELRPAPHPVFGDIGVDGWARLHVIHFEHHLSQFGV